MYNRKLIKKGDAIPSHNIMEGPLKSMGLAVPSLFLQCIIPSSKCSISDHILR